MSDSRRSKPLWRRFLAPSICAVALAALWFTRDRTLPYAATWLNVGETPRACDYVLVLPGGEETRPFVAAAMVRAGLAKKALVPMTAESPETADGIRRHPHEVIRDVFAKRGVALEDVVTLPGKSASTFSDAQALDRLLAERPTATVAIVTNHFHTRRSAWVFSQVLGERAKQTYMVASPVDEFSEQAWWHTRDGMHCYTQEYPKLVAYWGLYGGWTTRFFMLLACCLPVVAVVAWRFRRRRRVAFRPAESR